MPEPTDPIDDDLDEFDELPDDLDMAAAFVGPRTFPNNNRRRIPAAIYILCGLAAMALYVSLPDSPLVNLGTLWAGVVLVLFGVYGMVAGWTLKVEENDALVSAAKYLGFPVGHSAAQLVWRGWLSKPTWRILTYSTEDPPKQRAIVVVDGITGDVLEGFAEPNPEDWSSSRSPMGALADRDN
ncbi:MAG: hypothetical protein R2735_03815 [Microthrixaceae bacterium]